MSDGILSGEGNLVTKSSGNFVGPDKMSMTGSGGARLFLFWRALFKSDFMNGTVVYVTISACL
jgi:hypothetical protein